MSTVPCSSSMGLLTGWHVEESAALTAAMRACAGLTCHNAHGAKEVRREAAVLKGLLPTDYKCAPCITIQPVLQLYQQNTSFCNHIMRHIDMSMHLKGSCRGCSQ